jgi:hypothetical protein
MLTGLKTVMLSIGLSTAVGIVIGLLMGALTGAFLLWGGLMGFLGAGFGVLLAYGLLPES